MKSKYENFEIIFDLIKQLYMMPTTSTLKDVEYQLLMRLNDKNKDIS